MKLRDRSGITTLLVLLLCLTTLFLKTEAIWLTIPSSGTKCVSEDIQTHVVVLADYYVVADEGLHTISAKVLLSLDKLINYFLCYLIFFCIHVAQVNYCDRGWVAQLI